IAEQASTAAGAAHFRGRRTGRTGTLHEVVNRRRRHSWREALAVFPLDRDLAANVVPVAALERSAHRHSSVANPLETVEDVAVAVDVALGDLPVVGSRVARRAGVDEHDALLELAGVDVDSDALDGFGTELDGRDAAIQRRAEILD